MVNYLLDTNALYEMLTEIARKQNDPERTENLELQKILQEGRFYISEATKIEIISVIGKRARGSQPEVQECKRKIDEKGTICGNNYHIEGKRPWNKNEVRNWLKTVKDILDKKSSYFAVDVLPLSSAVIVEAEVFIQNALRYNFKSMDAVIVGTGIDFQKRSKEDITLITGDKALLSAIERSKIQLSYFRLNPRK